MSSGSILSRWQSHPARRGVSSSTVVLPDAKRLFAEERLAMRESHGEEDADTS